MESNGIKTFRLNSYKLLDSSNLKLQMYTCTNCGKVEFFQPSKVLEHSEMETTNFLDPFSKEDIEFDSCHTEPPTK